MLRINFYSRRSASHIGTALSGIWVCGLSSFSPSVNLGKLQPFLSSFHRLSRINPATSNHLDFYGQGTFHWTTRLDPSPACVRTAFPSLDRSSPTVQPLSSPAHLPYIQCLFCLMIEYTHGFCFALECHHGYGNLDQELSMHEEYAHSEEKDGRLAWG